MDQVISISKILPFIPTSVCDIIDEYKYSLSKTKLKMIYYQLKTKINEKYKRDMGFDREGKPPPLWPCIFHVDNQYECDKCRERIYERNAKSRQIRDPHKWFFESSMTDMENLMKLQYYFNRSNNKNISIVGMFTPLEI